MRRLSAIKGQDTKVNDTSTPKKRQRMKPEKNISFGFDSLFRDIDDEKIRYNSRALEIDHISDGAIEISDAFAKWISGRNMGK